MLENKDEPIMDYELWIMNWECSADFQAVIILDYLIFLRLYQSI